MPTTISCPRGTGQALVLAGAHAALESAWTRIEQHVDGLALARAAVLGAVLVRLGYDIEIKVKPARASLGHLVLSVA